MRVKDDHNHKHDEETDNDDDNDNAYNSDEEQGAEALQITAQTNEAVINRRKVDESYECKRRSFKKWVGDMRQRDRIQEGEKYLTRLNVDLYFQQVITLKDNIEPKTARCVVAALQCIARQDEGLQTQIYYGGDGHVFQALQAQMQRYAPLCMLLQNDVDTHANLPTNRMDEDEFRRELSL
jgi:hypothetical protein